MNRRDFLKTSALATTGLVAVRLQAAQSKKPNFIVVMTDDQGWGDLGCYGHPVLKTPNIDNLAKQGTLYTHFYCPASICSPTRAGMMTGKYPGRVGMHSQISTKERMESVNSAYFLDTEYTTLPRLLKQADYHTIHIGKWHLGGWFHQDEQVPRPDKYGFDEYLEPYYNWPATKYGEKWQQKTHHAYSTELIVDQGIRYLNERSKEAKPFFLQMWLNDPHDPLIPNEEHMHHYNEMKSLQPYDKHPELDPTRIWYCVLTEMDKQLGRLFSEVDKLGLSEDTYIIFTSDNGAANPRSYDSLVGMGSNGPFRGQKGSLYEGGIRTPFIVRRPGRVPAGRIDNSSVINGVDFLPTFCALAGVNLPAGEYFDGEDVSDALHGKEYSRTKPQFWQWRFRQPREVLHRSPMLAVREGKWKLLANPDKSRIELYDIAADPMEVDNKADNNKQIVERLFDKLLEFHNSLPEGVIDRLAGDNVYRFPGGRL